MYNIYIYIYILYTIDIYIYIYSIYTVCYIRNHQSLMQSEGHQTLTDFSPLWKSEWHRTSQQKCWVLSECPALHHAPSEHQTATSGPAECHSAERPPQTAVPAAENRPESPSHSPPAHAQQMPEAAARCRQRAGRTPEPDPWCHQGQCPRDQAEVAWPDYFKASQSSLFRDVTATEASDHSSESTENQWEFHQSLSENRRSQPESYWICIRAYQKREHLPEPYQKPLGMLIFFSLQLQRGPPPKKKIKNK